MLELFFGDNAAVFGVPAVLGTAVFVIRLALMMLGADHSFDSHGVEIHHGDTDAAFKAFSFQGIIAFAMGFGWAGLGFLRGSGVSFGVSFLLASAVGLGMMWLMGLVMKGLNDLQTSGNIPLESTLMQEGTVYLTVPERGKGRGQVKLVVSQRQRIYDAVAEADALPSGARVRVVRVNDDSTLTVAPA